MNTSPPRYSTLFSTIYDEAAPVGSLGRGAHYSVLRCAEWHDVTCAPLLVAEVHDFAVIWDEDHDERVIAVAEQLYIEGLLSPVQFIGERKGCLTVIVAAKFYWSGTEDDINVYKARVRSIAEGVDTDPWSSDVGMFDRSPGSPHQNEYHGLIMADDHRVKTYLANIDSLWSLGTRPHVRRTSGL
jgi:hypothetical protein